MKKNVVQNTSLSFEVIFTSDPLGGYTAEVPDLPGCVSEGDSFEEAKKNIMEAIELYLETLEMRKLPIPERKSGSVIKMDVFIPKTVNYA